MRLMDVITAPWAITPEKKTEIDGIYLAHLRGPKIDLKAVEAALGQPLNNESKIYAVKDGVAILAVDGVLAKRISLLTKISGGTSTSLLMDDFKQAMDDPTIRSIVLHIDSPGGAVDGTQELANAIFAARGAGKPIVALCDGCACSAAYWIAAAADRVYMTSDTTLVGSIGIVATHVDVSGKETMDGRKTTEVAAGKYKRIASSYGPLSEEGKATIQATVDHLYSVFVDAVATFRGVSVDTVLAEMADGRVFIGKQAIEAGLVDGVSTMDALLADLAREPAAMRARAGVAHTPPTTTLQEDSMKITREQLQAEAPELLQALLTEGQEQGAAAELRRVRGVLDATIIGHEDLGKQLAFDGKTTADEAAHAMVAAENRLGKTRLAELNASAPPPVQSAGDPLALEAAKAKADEEAKKTPDPKARWDSDAELRGSFGDDFAAYQAWLKAEANGQAHVLGTR